MSLSSLTVAFQKLNFSDYINKFNPSDKASEYCGLMNILKSQVNDLEKTCDNCRRNRIGYISIGHYTEFCGKIEKQVLSKDKVGKITDLYHKAIKSLDKDLETLEKDLNNQTVIHSSVGVVSLFEYEKICKIYVEKITRAAAPFNGLEVVADHFQVDPAKIGSRMTPQEYNLRRKEDLDCIYYALYTLNEEHCKGWMATGQWNNEEKEVLCLTDKAIWVLLQWGYEVVQTAQKGDLIVYFSSQDDKPQHFGLFLDEKTVESKWGRLRPIIKHNIEDVPVYGDYYRIFRKINN